nr:hypothetical protein [Tanacetum cinerariifolium]
MYDSLERATTTVTGLDVEQDRGNITKTQSNATLNEPSSIRTGSSSGPRLYKVGLSARVESSADEESLGEEDVSKLGRISDIDANQDIYLVNVYRDEDIFGVNDQDDTLIKSQDKVEEDEQERIIKEKDQLIEEAEEQEQLTDVEKARLFMKFFKNKRKFFAAKRNEEKRNRALTKDQQRSIMSTYLKNMDAWKPRDLKKKSFAQIKELLDKAMERIKNFIDFRTELDENESAELKRCLEIVPDDEDDVTVHATPLSSKYPTIVDYKIYKEGRKSFLQIIRTDGDSQIYLRFGEMLKNFDREDLKVL